MMIHLKAARYVLPFDEVHSEIGSFLCHFYVEVYHNIPMLNPDLVFRKRCFMYFLYFCIAWEGIFFSDELNVKLICFS